MALRRLVAKATRKTRAVHTREELVSPFLFLMPNSRIEILFIYLLSPIVWFHRAVSFKIFSKSKMKLGAAPCPNMG